jgi:hypothetical protein
MNTQHVSHLLLIDSFSEIAKLHEIENFYKTFLNEAKEKHECPLCERKFEDGFDKFIQKVTI